MPTIQNKYLSFLIYILYNNIGDKNGIYTTSNSAYNSFISHIKS